MRYADIAIGPIQAALRDLVTRRHLAISDTARVFAAVDLSLADAVGTVWVNKLHYGWWRPITAIREADTDSNPATAAVPVWEPLITTPPYPDWPSGLCSVGVLTTTMSRLNANGTMDLNIASPTAGVTRHYDNAAAMQGDAVSARVWSGIHFRTADEVSIRIGTQVANWTLDHYFAPTIK